MSWRHPDIMRAEKIAQTRSAFFAPGEDFRDLEFSFIKAKRHEAFQELPGSVHIEFLIPCFDAKKKAPPRGQYKTRHVEKWMIRRRQTIHRQHSEDSC